MIPNWLYVSQTAGTSGTTVITVSAGTNDDIVSRSGYLVVNNDANLSEDVTIIQSASGYDQTQYYDYLTFYVLTGGTIAVSGWGYYKKNNDDWQYISNGDITVVAGDIVKWKSEGGISYFNRYSYGTITAATDIIFNVYGNIMSLIYGDYFTYQTNLDGNSFGSLFENCFGLRYATNLQLPATLLSDSCYSSMFANCSSLINAPSILPAMVLTEDCYNNMFAGCTSLINSPSLPATTLAEGCYRGMFEGCTSLRTAPSLPARTLVYECYQGMFYDCSGLTTAPSLPAMALAQGCYSYMFGGCGLLSTAPTLPAKIMDESCYQGMFQNCVGISIAPSLPATTLAEGCYRDMFEGCENLTIAPELPSTSLAKECYDGMFNGCSNLRTAPALPATTLVDGCYENMFLYCTNLQYAPELPASVLVKYCYYYMFYECNSLGNIKCLATNISAQNSTTNWVKNVNSSGTFIKTSGVTWESGNNGIPSGWTVQEV